MKTLYVVFLWHMHQPLYKDYITSHYYLPWVRLHATKGYWDMINALAAHPKAKAVVNMTPSLLYQLDDISKTHLKDKHRELTLKEADKLTKSDKQFLLTNFFMINWDNHVLKSARYTELLEKRGRYTGKETVAQVVDKFSENELRDLQAHYNLAWFGFAMSSGDKLIMRLKEKDRLFTEEEKRLLVDKQEEIIKDIIPSYKKLQEEGKAEISTTPFYHPILPLLCDGSVKEGFAYHDDARAHVLKAVELYKSLFGAAPVGFWPAEAAVSKESLSLLKDCGVKWIATDEDILINSLDEPVADRGKVLYRPYELDSAPGLSIFFRDKNLSNAISFHYATIEQSKAVGDIIYHLKNIRNWIQQFEGDYVVTIALDGENPWEYFPDGGKEFLDGIYGQLAEEEGIELSTFKDVLEKCKGRPAAGLKRIHAGSWINHNFDIWAGDNEDKKAWEALKKTRDTLVKHEPSNKKAWEEIYAAEGSDWFWWYGDEFTSENDEVFDSLFRMHLANVHKLLGKSIPAYLKEPIQVLDRGKPAREIAGPFTPNINGYVDSFYEWDMAGLYNVSEKGSTMFGRESIVKSFYYGYDEKNLYVRVDANMHPVGCGEAGRVSIILKTIDPGGVSITMPLDKAVKGHIETDTEKKPFVSYEVNEVLECMVPFASLRATPGRELSFVIMVNCGGAICETWPKKRLICVTVPDKKFIMQEWNL